MAFMLKLPFVDVVSDGSLKHTYVNGKKLGYEFQIRLSNYRGHYLSCLKELSIKVDDEAVNPDDIAFCLRDKEFTIKQLPSLVSEFWNLIEPATIKVYLPDSLKDGAHEIEVTMQLRIPYMATPGSKHSHDYATLDSSGHKVLTI
ncbi:DUF6379 domain-containing protein [Cohnella sp. WQ 127256]|uniref:C-glycoside deglycosidase beta subunit domain-containing protein n=1 Tax=Cohnella sp. WQ 127256 TaxID=2938790 RepID=UPI0021174832|nr:DUF6379 domain-containing protein [Cohnella sp. WQ 127256]